MIGNDIVDLDDIETSPSEIHPRFDERAFSSAERERLARSREPDRERWVFWSAKEAVYKLVRSRKPETVFSPPKFEVTRTNPVRAEVTFEGERFSVALAERRSTVHAVAQSGERGRVLSAVARYDRANPSRGVRALAIESIAPYLGATPGELRIDRGPDRRPVLLRNDAPTPGALSLSHHGRFVAFAYELPPGAGWGS